MKINKILSKKLGVYLAIFTLIVLIVYAAAGDPSEFGDASGVTAWIGGTLGIGNFTGDVYSKKNISVDCGKMFCLDNECSTYLCKNCSNRVSMWVNEDPTQVCI